MVSSFLVPSYPLKLFIDNFYYYTGYHPEHLVDRLLPDGNVQLLMELTDNTKYIYDNKTLKEIQSCRNTWFSGFRTEPITIPSGRESEMIVISFKKGRAFPFFCEPMFSLKNCVVDAELVMETEILEIREKIREIPDPLDKLRYLDRAFTRFYSSGLEENTYVDYMISGIESNPSNIRLKELTAKVGYSQKHLIKIFKDKVGVSPKEFLKIIRFQKVVQQLESGHQVDWNSVAFDCGFYDQSHFIADFKKYSGFTPTEYLSRKNEMLNYVPIA